MYRQNIMHSIIKPAFKATFTGAPAYLFVIRDPIDDPAVSAGRN